MADDAEKQYNVSTDLVGRAEETDSHLSISQLSSNGGGVIGIDDWNDLCAANPSRSASRSHPDTSAIDQRHGTEEKDG